MMESLLYFREGNVVEDWDILDLEVGEAFVNLTQKRGVCFKYKFPRFQ